MTSLSQWCMAHRYGCASKISSASRWSSGSARFVLSRVRRQSVKGTVERTKIKNTSTYCLISRRSARVKAHESLWLSECNERLQDAVELLVHDFECTRHLFERE